MRRHSGKFSNPTKNNYVTAKYYNGFMSQNAHDIVGFIRKLTLGTRKS
jgi:hypothetical protein